MRVPGTLTVEEALKLGLPISLHCDGLVIERDDNQIVLDCGGEIITVRPETKVYAQGPHGLLTADDITKLKAQYDEANLIEE